MLLRGAHDVKSQIYYVHDLEGKIWDKIALHTVFYLFLKFPNIGSNVEFSELYVS